MTAYADQLNRVRRFLKRIETHDRSPVDYDDDLWSFFQNCWHLKDWIKHDSKIPQASRDGISHDIWSSKHLLICADLANATKHLQLTNVHAGAKHSHKNYRLRTGGPSSVEYFIDAGDGSKIDGLDLARRCIAEWEALLKKYGLPT